MSCLNQSLAGLAKDCSSSMGGIRNVYIANYDDVTGVSLTEGQVSAIECSGKFYKYYFRKNTGSMTSTLNVNDESGNFVTTQLSLSFNKMDTTKRIEMSALSANELAVVVEDMNGTYFYLGYNDAVVALNGEGTTGVQRTDGNKYTLVLKDESLDYPHILSAAGVESLMALVNGTTEE